MKKLKVITVVGTRPEIIRLSCVIDKLNTNVSIDHILVHTGQNYDYELKDIFFSELQIPPPNYILKGEAENATKAIGLILPQIDAILETENPDAFLVLGDTNSGLSAIAAKKRKIPIFHMEAGNRCFDQRVPEEVNRKIIDHIADINLPYSTIAREYLLQEGIAPDRVIKTGSPLFEVLHRYKDKIKAATPLKTMDLKKNAYFLVSAHREETVENPEKFKLLLNSLQTLSKVYDYPIIVSTHPRTRKKLNEIDYKENTNIRFLKPMGFFDYNSLQLNAHTVLSDSGSISEEASILNFSALNIRETHERPEAMEETAVVMTGLTADSIIRGIKTLETQKGNPDQNLKKILDYQIPNVSEKIIRILLSYTDYVNQTVWRK